MTRVVADVKMLPNHLVDTIQRPQIGRIASADRALQQQALQTRLLFVRQSGWATWDRLAAQASRAVARIALPPALYRAARGTHGACDRRRLLAGLQQFDRKPAPFFKLLRRSARAHVRQHSTLYHSLCETQ
jgi:hypothetical protein